MSQDDRELTISLSEFRRRISAWQHGVLVHQLCRAVWQRWMDVAVLSGALILPGYDRQRQSETMKESSLKTFGASQKVRWPAAGG